MSGRGEVPDRDHGERGVTSVVPGEKVFNFDGELVGEVRGMEEGGFFVSTREGQEHLSVEHARAGQSWGEAELMWRCVECGEMGALEEGFPDECPNCGAPREEIMYWTED